MSDNVLYHYTSVNSFEGIIKTNSIRMTKSNYLNDPADCNLFVELIGKYMDSNQGLLDRILNSSKITNSRDVEEIYKNNCGLTDYIKYILGHISLYVMSLTKKHDSMCMWNAYGQGGMELAFSIDALMRSFKNALTSENEFLIGLPVIYVDKDEGVREIIEKLGSWSFSDFVLINKESDNIFADHCSVIEESSTEATKLYKTGTDKLNIFIDTYVKSYLLTLDYLITAGKIDTSMLSETIFENVFDNVSNLNGAMYWKHDISLYMLVLSALIKSDTYKDEEEYRIVYFEYDTNPEKAKKEEYFVKHVASGDFICPYVSFGNNATDILKDSLKKITISPATRNLPIDNDLYLSTLKKFILSNGFNKEVVPSPHMIRWY